MSRIVVLICLSLVAVGLGDSPDPETCAHKICVNVEEGHFIDNPLSCAAFFRCSGGRAIAGECTGGLWFNPATQICDAPWNVACDASISEIVDLKCVEDNGDDLYWPIRCPEEPLIAIQHPLNCSVYFLCIEGDSILRNCAPGLEFNANTQQCMQPEEAQCTLPRCPPGNDPPTFLPNENDCSKFSICLNGHEVEHSCADGLHWSVEDNWCTFPENANCEVVSEIVCNQDSPLINPHPFECRKYFLCDDDNIPHVRECADGLLFDTTINQCAIANEENCFPGSIFA